MYGVRFQFSINTNRVRAKTAIVGFVCMLVIMKNTLGNDVRLTCCAFVLAMASPLLGVPKVPKVTSSPLGAGTSSYTLTWHAESRTPIVMYSLQHRKYAVSGFYIFVFSLICMSVLSVLMVTPICLCIA